MSLVCSGPRLTALAAALVAGLGGPAVASASVCTTNSACRNTCEQTFINDRLACEDEPTVHQQDICISSAEIDYEFCLDLCDWMNPDWPDEGEIEIEIWF